MHRLASRRAAIRARSGSPPQRPPQPSRAPPIAAEHRLAGVIHLEWSSAATTIEPLDHREAIRRLLVLRSEKGYPRRPQALLNLAMLPTLLLKRPRSIDKLDAAVAQVECLLSESRGRAAAS